MVQAPTPDPKRARRVYYGTSLSVLRSTYKMYDTPHKRYQIAISCCNGANSDVSQRPPARSSIFAWICRSRRSRAMIHITMPLPEFPVRGRRPRKSDANLIGVGGGSLLLLRPGLVDWLRSSGGRRGAGERHGVGDGVPIVLEYPAWFWSKMCSRSCTCSEQVTTRFSGNTSSRAAGSVYFVAFRGLGWTGESFTAHL